MTAKRGAASEKKIVKVIGDSEMLNPKLEMHRRIAIR